MADPDWSQVADRLNALLAERRLSSHDLAARAGVDRKTIDRLRAGQAVRPQTLQWIEQALKTPLRQAAAEAVADVAAPELGGYRRGAVAGLIGGWLSYRRSFDRPRQLVAAEVEIHWDPARPGLRFGEHQHNRPPQGGDYQYRFAGDVLIPPNLGVIHLVVRSDDGRIRVVSTSMPRDERGTWLMKGFLLTLNEIADIGYYPVTSPLVLAKLAQGQTPDAGQTGVLTVGHPRYDWADALLADAERKFLPWSSNGHPDRPS